MLRIILSILSIISELFRLKLSILLIDSWHYSSNSCYKFVFSMHSFSEFSIDSINFFAISALFLYNIPISKSCFLMNSNAILVAS